MKIAYVKDREHMSIDENKTHINSY